MAKPRPSLKVYALVQRAVEDGVLCGIRRYRKYHDDGEFVEESFAEHIEREVLQALDDVLDFGE